MKAVVQRVSEASVKIETEVTGSIDRGLLVLLGIQSGDGKEDVEWLSRKIANMRIFDADQGIMNHSVLDINGDILVISQFTLYANTKKGNRPSYILAARPEDAEPLYNEFIDELESITHKNVFSGKFGAMMDVSLINKGPVTIIIDSKTKM